MKKAFLLTSVYVASIVGAGFASGQEIVSFFVKYGKISILGILLSSIIFGLFAYCIINISHNIKCTNFDQYLFTILNRPIAIFVKLITFIFMICVFTAMLAGGGETFHTIFNIKKSIGMIIICALCLYVFVYDKKGMIAINGILGVVIVLGIVGVCVYILKYRELNVFASQFKDNWVLSSVSYVSYNILTAGIILVEMSSILKTKTQAKLVGIFSSFSMFVMMFCIWAVISIYNGKIPLGEIPMLTLASRQGNFIFYTYSIILFFAMITTAISSGYSTIKIMQNHTNLSHKFCALIIVCTGYFLGGCNFSFIVDVIYRICGYLGFIFMYSIIAYGIKSKTNDKLRNTEKTKEN